MAGDGQLTFECESDRSQLSDDIVSEFERAPEFFFSGNNCISGHVVFQALKWSAKHAWRLSQHFEAKFSGF